MEQDVAPDEYVTVLVPKKYNTNDDKTQLKTTQRLITVEQPGLELEPKPEQPAPGTSTTSTTTKPAQPTKSTSTATTTRTEVSHVTEVVKKYEYHYTYIYNYQEWDNGDGTWTLIRKDGKPLNGDLSITWTSPDGKTVTNNVNITVNTGSSNNREGGSSNPACVGAISLLSLPLLLAIPVGILSQVQIPGFEHISAQLNAAIQQANTEIQKGLGIFDQNRAGAAANVDDAAAQIAPLIGAGAAAVGALAVIAGVGAGVMHACGVVDLNEASSNGSSSNSNGGSSINGSSEK